MDKNASDGAARGYWIDDWHPDDEPFWKASGKRIARRNLIWSILAEHIGFSVWLVWSVVATRLPKLGFPYSTDQLFSLVAIPGLIGALMRFPVHVRGPEVRRPQLDDRQRRAVADPDHAGGGAGDQPVDAVLVDGAGRGDRGPGRRQLRVEHGQHLVLLSRSRKGIRAGPERRGRQHRRQHVAVADPDRRSACRSSTSTWASRRDRRTSICRTPGCSGTR